MKCSNEYPDQSLRVLVGQSGTISVCEWCVKKNPLCGIGLAGGAGSPGLPGDPEIPEYEVHTIMS